MRARRVFKTTPVAWVSPIKRNDGPPLRDRRGFFVFRIETLLFRDFKSHCVKEWTEYFRFVGENLSRLETNAVPLFPTHIIFCDFVKYFSMELVGASRVPTKLLPKVAKYPDVNSLWNPLGVDGDRPALIFDDRISAGPKGAPILGNLMIHQGVNVEEARARFPGIDLYETRLEWRDSKGPIFCFSDNFSGCILSNFLFLQAADGVFRARNFLFFGAVKRNLTKRELNEFLDRAMFPKGKNSPSFEVQGITTVEERTVASAEAAALQGLYLSRGIHETTIDSFFEEHPQILNAIFNAQSTLYGTELKWCEGNERTNRESIRPDAFLERPDGKYDIVDFKLAGLDKRSITRSKGSPRARFVDYVNEGLSQLEDYEYYFSFQANRDYALNKYGICVDNPRKILVVGNSENVDIEEVRAALRPFRSGFDIVDYDFLVRTYLGV